MPYTPKGIRNSAAYVEQGLQPQSQGLFIAAGRAYPKPAGGQVWTMSSEPALSALLCSPSTSTKSRSAVAGPVDADSCTSVVRIEHGLPRDVYCLTSAVGCFLLANGMVVGNCDAWSYPLHRIFAAGKPLAGPVRSVRVY